MKRLLLSTVMLSLLAGSGRDSRADDWAVRRSPFNPQVVARYKALLKRRPNDGYALVRLVKLYRKHRSIAKLIGEYRAAARAKPRAFPYQVILGHLYRRTGNLAQAVTAYERARKLRPKSASVPAALAALYRKQGKRAESVTAYKRALALSGSKRERKRYLRALANMALADRDIKAARGFFEQLVKIEPRNVFLRIELAQALAKNGNHQEAVDEYQRILKRTRDSGTRADILKQIGEQQHKLGKTAAAVATYRKAMKLAARGHWIRRELTERVISIYREKEDLKALIAHYDKSWKRKGHFEYQVLGRLYDETGDEARALKAYRAALSKSRHAIDTRLRLIALLERSGADKKVIAEYRTLARIAPGEPRYQLELAKRLYRAGNQAEATQVLERCGRRFPRDASAHAAIADLYARWGDQRRALREAQVLVRIEPRDESHLVNLGEQYFLRGQKRKAIEIWKRLLHAIPQRHKAYAKLAGIYGQHDMNKQAISLYRKAIKLSPKTLPYRRSLALLLEQKRRTSDALKAWHEVLRLATNSGTVRSQTRREARTHIISILHRSYQLRHRIRSYRSRFDHGDVEAGFFLAEAYLKQRDLTRAAKVYTRLLDKQPKSVEALTALESIYRRQRRLAAAVTLLKKLAQLQPAAARDYYQRIANLQLQLYNDKEALIYAHKAVALSGQDAKAYQRLGQLYERKEDFDGAIKAYRKALKLSPNLFAVHFALGRLQTRRGQYQAAEKRYRQVMRTARAPEVLRKAFRLGVDLSAYLGRLEALEKELQPLAVTAQVNAEIYRQLLVDIYRRRVPPLMHRARHGDGATRRAARAALHRIGVRGMAPLLEELASSARASTARQQLIRLLGYLGNPNAALPLLRLAEREPEERTVTVYGKRPRYYYRHRYGRYRKAETQVNQRVEATVAVGRLADERAVPGLVRLLRNPEGALREAAAWALSRVRHRGAQRALFAALGDRRTTVQAMACAGLGVQGARELRPVLEEVMSDSARAARVRAACAWGLGALGDRRATDRLVEVLRSDDDEVQRCAAWSLGALASPRAVAPLVRSLWNKRPDVRKSVVWALVRISQAPAPIRVDRTADVVIKAGRIDAERFVRRLTVGVEDLTGRELAARMPALIKSHRAPIVAGLRASLGRHRDVVLRVLRDLDLAHDRPTLGPLTAGHGLLDSDGRVELQRAVKPVVSQLTGEVGRLLGHRDPVVRQRAASVYAKIADVDVGQRLQAVVQKDASWAVRTAVLSATAVALRRKRVTREQVLALTVVPQRSRHWREREAAVVLLGALRHRSAAPRLQRSLADRNGFVRQAAVSALAGSGGPVAIAGLRAALRDEVPHVRAAACQGLGKLRVRRARAAVRRLLEDPSPAVRRAARQALSRLGR